MALNLQTRRSFKLTKRGLGEIGRQASAPLVPIVVTNLPEAVVADSVETERKTSDGSSTASRSSSPPPREDNPAGKSVSFGAPPEEAGDDPPLESKKSVRFGVGNEITVINYVEEEEDGSDSTDASAVAAAPSVLRTDSARHSVTPDQVNIVYVVDEDLEISDEEDDSDVPPPPPDFEDEEDFVIPPPASFTMADDDDDVGSPSLGAFAEDADGERAAENAKTDDEVKAEERKKKPGLNWADDSAMVKVTVAKTQFSAASGGKNKLAAIFGACLPKKREVAEEPTFGF